MIPITHFKIINILRYLSLVVGCSLMVSNSDAAQGSHVLLMADNKRLEASICPDSMNRLAVANDRIVQVFGDEGTFENQSDENTGQVFIKPTAENSSKPLSLTLITEQGKTQDLSLKPTAKSATTLILKHADGTSKSAHPDSARLERSLTDLSYGNVAHKQSPHSYQEQVLNLLKQAAMGKLPLKEGEKRSRQSPEGYQVSYQKSYEGGHLVVHVFEVVNITETSIVCEEKSFYQPGDIALSFAAHTIASQSKTWLYVVCPHGAGGS